MTVGGVTRGLLAEGAGGGQEPKEERTGWRLPPGACPVLGHLPKGWGIGTIHIQLQNLALQEVRSALSRGH